MSIECYSSYNFILLMLQVHSIAKPMTLILSKCLELLLLYSEVQKVSLFHSELWMSMAVTSGFRARTISLALGRALGSSEVQQQNS